MSGFLLSLFKANYLENLPGYPSFSLCIPIALAKIYFFRVVLSFQIKIDSTVLAPVVQRLDNAIHWTNRYPLDSVVCLRNIYPLDSDLSG